MMLRRRLLLAAGLAAGLAIPSLAIPAFAEDTLKVGVLATFEGAFTVLGEDSMRGALMAIDDFGGKAGGKKIEVVKGSSDGSPDSAVRAIRKLVENALSIWREQLHSNVWPLARRRCRADSYSARRWDW